MSMPHSLGAPVHVTIPKGALCPVYVFARRQDLDWWMQGTAAYGRELRHQMPQYDPTFAKFGTYMVNEVYVAQWYGVKGNLFVRTYDAPQIRVFNGAAVPYIGWGLRSHDEEGRNYGLFSARG